MVTKKTKRPTIHFIIIALLVLNLVASAFTLFGKDGAIKLEELKSGGKENFTKVMKLYKSDDYKAQQTAAIDQALGSFGIAADVEENNNEPVEADEDMIKKFEEIVENSHVKGEENTRLVLLEYSEVLCPFCKRQKDNKVVEQVLEKYPNEVSTILRNFIVHAPAKEYSNAFLCAGKVGGDEAYYDYVAKAFALNSINTSDIAKLAKEVGVDGKEFDKCVEDGEFNDQIDAETNEGRSMFGVTGTPGNVIIDLETGKYTLIAGAYPFEKFDQEIQNMLK